MKIGPKLKAARENNNMSYYRLTQGSDIAADYLKKIEESTEDNEPNISIDILERLCNSLGIPVSDFLNENEEVMYLTPKEKELIAIFRRFGEREQDACVNFMDLISSKQA